MSGDVQTRKRRDKKKKKDDTNEETQHLQKLSPKIQPPASEVVINTNPNKESSGYCAKIVFFILLTTLAVLIGIIIVEHRGLTDVEYSNSESKFSHIFESWIESSPLDEHDDEVADKYDKQSYSDEDDASDENETSHEDDEQEEEESDEEEEERDKDDDDDVEDREEDEDSEYEEEENLSENSNEDDENEDTYKAETDEENEIQNGGSESNEDLDNDENDKDESNENDDNDDSTENYDKDESTENQDTDDELIEEKHVSVEKKIDEESNEDNSQDEENENIGRKEDSSVDQENEDLENENKEDTAQVETVTANNLADGSSNVMIKFGVGMGIVVVAYIVLIRKWRNVPKENIAGEEVEIEKTHVKNRRNTIVSPPRLEEVEHVMQPGEERFRNDKDELSEGNVCRNSAKKRYEDLQKTYFKGLEEKLNVEKKDVNSQYEEIDIRDKWDEEYEDEDDEEEDEDDEEENEDDDIEDIEDDEYDIYDDDNDDELMKKLEAKYGRVQTNQSNDNLNTNPTEELEDDDISLEDDSEDCLNEST